MDGEKAVSLPRQLGEHLASRNRVLGGIGFDVFLIAAVVLLTLTLGFYPSQNPPPDEVEPVTRLAKKKPRVLPPAAPATQPAHATPKQDKTAPASDRYDSPRECRGS